VTGVFAVLLIADTLSGMGGTSALYSARIATIGRTRPSIPPSGQHPCGEGKGGQTTSVGSFILCGIAAPVLCVMKGANTPGHRGTRAGKKIYLSKSAWILAVGLSAADGKCLADAASIGNGSKGSLVASTRALTDVHPARCRRRCRS